MSSRKENNDKIRTDIGLKTFNDTNSDGFEDKDISDIKYKRNSWSNNQLSPFLDTTSVSNYTLIPE